MTSVLLTAAAPIALLASGTWQPSMPSLTTAQQWITNPMSRGFIAALTIAAAVAIWLPTSTAVLTYVYSAIARQLRRTIPALHVPGPVHGLTAALLGATAVTTATGATAHATPETTNTDAPAAEPVTATPTSHRASATPRPAAPSPTYTVRRGDSLCAIAARTLGDADRWPEIFALNRGTRFPRVGGVLHNPNLIYPGWVLQLPANAKKSGPTTSPRPDDEQPRTEPRRPDAPAVPTTPDASADTPTPQSSAATNPTATTAPATDPGATASAPHITRVASPPPAHDPLPAPHRSDGIDLSNGSWLDIGLAAAIITAAALVWAHRRRRYTPRPPSPAARVDDPDAAPMPPVVQQIRRRLRGAAPRTATPEPHGDNSHLPASRRDGSLTSDTPAPDGDTHLGPATVSRPAVPSLTHPMAEVWPSAGLGLTGPGADAAARGFLTAALAAGGIDAPHQRTTVVLPSTTAATLLDAEPAALPATPRLTVTTGVDDALDLIEAQILHRSRLADAHDADAVADLRTLDPSGEPLPPVLLLAHTTNARQDTRITALLTQGARLDIHGLLLGQWPHGDTVDVAADGTTSPFPGATHRISAAITRFAVLTAADTVALLGTLAESHTGQPPAPATIEGPGPSATPTPTDASTPPAPTENSGRHSPTSSADAAAGPISIIDTRPHPIAALHATTNEDGADTVPSAEQDTPDRRQRHPGRVRISVLGTPSITDAASHPPLRHKALEVLVYLAVLDGEATVDAILDDLLPEAPASKAPGRLYTYVSNLRAVMRHTGGPGDYLTHPQHRYTLNPALVDVDLWQMRTAIRDAERATDPQIRVAALRRAVDTYRGHLADGVDYEWIETYREGVRRQALDTYLALADALADNPAEQLTVLDEAIRHSPYTEELYQQAMRARAALGHLDAIRSLRRALTRALAEIDAEPGEDTIALAHELTAAPQRDRQRRQMRPSTRHEDGAPA